MLIHWVERGARITYLAFMNKLKKRADGFADIFVSVHPACFKQLIMSLSAFTIQEPNKFCAVETKQIVLIYNIGKFGCLCLLIIVVCLLDL